MSAISTEDWERCLDEARASWAPGSKTDPGTDPSPHKWAASYREQRMELGRCPVGCNDGFIYAKPSHLPDVFRGGVRCPPEDPRCDRRHRCIHGCLPGDEPQRRRAACG